MQESNQQRSLTWCQVKSARIQRILIAQTITSSSNGLIEPFPCNNMNMAPFSSNFVFVTFCTVRNVKTTNHSIHNPRLKHLGGFSILRSELENKFQKGKQNYSRKKNAKSRSLVHSHNVSLKMKIRM